MYVLGIGTCLLIVMPNNITISKCLYYIIYMYINKTSLKIQMYVIQQ